MTLDQSPRYLVTFISTISHAMHKRLASFPSVITSLIVHVLQLCSCISPYAYKALSIMSARKPYCSCERSFDAKGAASFRIGNCTIDYVPYCRACLRFRAAYLAADAQVQQTPNTGRSVLLLCLEPLPVQSFPAQKNTRGCASLVRSSRTSFEHISRA